MSTSAAVKNIGVTLALVLSVTILAGCTTTTTTPTTTPSSPAASGPVTSAPAATEISGVIRYNNPASHVEGSVTYSQTPPVGGAHNARWLNCGIYTLAVPNENAVHDLEHGAVWVTYNPALAESEVAKLRELLPSTHTLMSPYAGMDSPIVISAWNVQLKVATASDPRLAQFLAKYRNSATAPEPGAPCTGGVEAPGRLNSGTV